MGPITMKSTRDMANPKRVVYDPVGKALNGVCPGMMTHKDQEIDRAVRKIVKDLITSRMGVCPSVKTHKDQEIDQVVRESANDPMNPRIGVCLRAARRCKSQSAGDG